VKRDEKFWENANKLTSVLTKKGKVQGGTPDHGEASLCMSCRHASIVKGMRESEMLIQCSELYNIPVVPFEKVTNCTLYSQKGLPSLAAMKEIALDINLSQPVSLKKVSGFAGKTEKPDDDEDDNEEDTFLPQLIPGGVRP
jgi:hypothetical protein